MPSFFKKKPKKGEEQAAQPPAGQAPASGQPTPQSPPPGEGAPISASTPESRPPEKKSFFKKREPGQKTPKEAKPPKEKKAREKKPPREKKPREKKSFFKKRHEEPEAAEPGAMPGQMPPGTPAPGEPGEPSRPAEAAMAAGAPEGGGAEEAKPKKKGLFKKRGEKGEKGEKPTRQKKEKPKKARKGGGGFGGKVSPVGLDIGRTSATAVRLRHSNSGSVLMQASLDRLPEGLIQEGEVRDVEALALALKEFWKEHRIRGRKVAIGLANQKIVVRTLDFPVLDEKELRSAIEFQAQDYIPIPIEDAVFDYHILGRFTDVDGIEKQKILVVAAQKDMVMDFVNALKKAKLQLAGIDLQAFAMLRSLVSTSFLDEGMPPQAIAVANIASDVTNLVVDVGGEPQFTRIISFGGDDFTRAVQEQLGITFNEAESYKAQIGLSRPGEGPGPHGGPGGPPPGEGPHGPGGPPPGEGPQGPPGGTPPGEGPHGPGGPPPGEGRQGPGAPPGEQPTQVIRHEDYGEAEEFYRAMETGEQGPAEPPAPGQPEPGQRWDIPGSAEPGETGGPAQPGEGEGGLPPVSEAPGPFGAHGLSGQGGGEPPREEETPGGPFGAGGSSPEPPERSGPEFEQPPRPEIPQGPVPEREPGRPYPGEEAKPAGSPPGFESGPLWPEGQGDAEGAEKEDTARRALEITAEGLADEIRRSLDYYISQEQSVPVSKLLLSGGGAMLPNLEAYLAQIFPFPVELGNPLIRITQNKSGLSDEELQALAPRLAIAIGLALEDEG